MEKSTHGICALGNRVRAGDEMNAGNCMNEEVSGEPFAVVGKAAPPEKPLRTEWPLGRPHQELVPIYGLLARIRRNRINPGATWRIAVPMRFDVIHVAQLAGIVDLLGACIHDRAHALAADLHNA